MVESVLSALVGLPGSFPKSILEQLYCREPVDACFCTKEFCSRHYLKNLPEFLKHKTEDWSLHTCNLLKRNFSTELFLKRHIQQLGICMFFFVRWKETPLYFIRPKFVTVITHHIKNLKPNIWLIFDNGYLLCLHDDVIKEIQSTLLRRCIQNPNKHLRWSFLWK